MNWKDAKKELLKDPATRKSYDHFDFWHWLGCKKDNVIIFWYKLRGKL